MTSDQFLMRLRSDLPGFAHEIDEHTTDHGGVLLHLLMADLARACVSAWRSRDVEFNRRALALVEAALGDGDDEDYVSNAVGVSFVENVGPWDPDVGDFVASWPQALLGVARGAGYPH